MRAKQKASALISALFMMTLIAIAATAMSLRLRFNINQTQLTIASDEMVLASQLVTYWAMSELGNKKKLFHEASAQGQVDQFPKNHEKDYPNTRLEGQLIDLQSRFNINNFNELSSFSTLYLLLRDPKIQISQSQKKDLIFNFYHWLSPHQPQGQSGQDSFYAAQKPPYLAAYQRMTSPSEMRLIKGNTPQIQELLLEKLVTLPEKTPLNLYTAPPTLLKALGSGLKNEQLEEIVSKRQENDLDNKNNLSALLTKLAIRPEDVTTNSQYFLVIAHVYRDDLNLKVLTVLKREITKDKNDKIKVWIVRQSFNAL